MKITGNHLVYTALFLFLCVILFQPKNPNPYLIEGFEPITDFEPIVDDSTLIPGKSKVGGVCTTSDDCEADRVCKPDLKKVCYLTQDPKGCPSNFGLTRIDNSGEEVPIDNNGIVSFIDRNNLRHDYQLCCVNESTVSTSTDELENLKGICPSYRNGKKLLSYGSDMDSGSLYNLIQDPYGNGYQFDLDRFNRNKLSFAACPIKDTKKIYESGKYKGHEVINSAYCVIGDPKNEGRCPINYDNYGKIQTVEKYRNRQIELDLCCLKKDAAKKRFSDLGNSNAENVCKEAELRKEGDQCNTDLDCPEYTVCRLNADNNKICRKKTRGETCKLIKEKNVSTHDCGIGLECVCSSRFFMGDPMKCPSKTVCSEGKGNGFRGCLADSQCHWGNCVSYCYQFPTGESIDDKGYTHHDEQCKRCFENDDFKSEGCNEKVCIPSKSAGPKSHCFSDEDCFGEHNKCLDYECKERIPLGEECNSKIIPSNTMYEYNRCEDGTKCGTINDVKGNRCVRAGINEPPKYQTVCRSNPIFGQDCTIDISTLQDLRCPSGYVKDRGKCKRVKGVDFFSGDVKTTNIWTDDRVDANLECPLGYTKYWWEYDYNGNAKDKWGNPGNWKTTPTQNWTGCRKGPRQYDEETDERVGDTYPFAKEGCPDLSSYCPKPDPNTDNTPRKICEEWLADLEGKPELCITDLQCNKGLFVDPYDGLCKEKPSGDASILREDYNPDAAVYHWINHDEGTLQCGDQARFFKDTSILPSECSYNLPKEGPPPEIYDPVTKLWRNSSLPNEDNYQCLLDGKLTSKSKTFAENKPKCQWNLVKNDKVKIKVCPSENVIAGGECKEWAYVDTTNLCFLKPDADSCKNDTSCNWDRDRTPKCKLNRPCNQIGTNRLECFRTPNCEWSFSSNRCVG